MGKHFIQVVPEHDGKTTSGINLFKLGRTFANYLLGVDAFKSTYNGSKSVPEAIAGSIGTSAEALKAKLRMEGYDPEVYFEKVAEYMGGDVSGWTDEDINKALSDAEIAAKDPSQQFWLWAGLGLVVLMAFTGGSRRGRKFIGRGVSRFRSFRAGRKARRHARRGRR